MCSYCRKQIRKFGKNAMDVPRAPSALERSLFNGARYRAAKNGIAFSIRVEDVVIPDVCPVLGLPLSQGIGKLCDTSPTLDRIVNSRGYVPGNVAVVSWRANAIKKDATVAELRKLVKFYGGQCA